MTSRICRTLLAPPFLAVAFALLTPLSDASATPRQSVNGRIAIDLAEAFTPSDRFAGFVDNGTGASVAVIELPAAAYDKLKAIPDSKESLANEGFGGTEKAELKGRKGDFIYLVGKQATPAGDVTKFVLMFAEGETAAVIVANVPQPAIDAGKYSRESVEAMLTTAAVKQTPPDAGGPFRFTYLGPFKEAFDNGGMTKAYNISGAKPQGSENQLVKETMLLASSSIHGEKIDIKAQSREVFRHLGGMTERRIDDQAEITIANLKGYQINGEVTDGASGNKIAVRLVLLSGEPFGYFMFLGSMPVAEKAKMMPELEKVIASFELVK